MSSSLLLRLIDYNNRALLTNGQTDSNVVAVSNTVDPSSTQFFRILSYSADIMQTLNIGSQSTGAGAGKVTFNPLSISRMSDAASPILFQVAASGTPYKTVELFVINEANMVIMKYLYKLVAVKTVAWTAGSDNNGVIEMVTFEYGGLLITVNQQTPDGKITAGTPVGWNRVKNIKDNDPTIPIS